jgi:hypothetical protein
MISRNIKNFYRSLEKKFRKVKFDGYSPACQIYPIDDLTDIELNNLNRILDWNCFTVDSKGRRFGNFAWGGKRTDPQDIPDSRILLMNDKFKLSKKIVLEIGCFEGVHTIGLGIFAKDVIAIDSRIEHVVKTIVRSQMYGFRPRVFKFDVDDMTQDYSVLKADVCHHVGVLYHLKDPVSHLIKLSDSIRTGIMLDTHIAETYEARDVYYVNDIEYPYKKYVEFGAKEVFSGMNDHSKWLTLEGLKQALRVANFINIEVIEVLKQRNGTRVLLFAGK